MSEPTTSYQSQYPGDKYEGNIQRERSLANDRLVAAARDYNIHDVEIRALQCFLGFAGPGGFGPFDPAGPKPGTGDTIVDRLIRIAGTASDSVCVDDGLICNYFGPDGIDPTGQNYIDTTASWIGPAWINPIAIPGVPPVPPFNPQGPAVVPWPKPGGGVVGGPGGFVWPLPPWPVAPGFFSLAGPQALAFRDWLLAYGALSQTNALRWLVQSSETINFWSRVYDELPSALREIVDVFDSWLSARTLPSVLNRASIFDVLAPTASIVRHLLSAFRVGVYTGTVTGGHISFTTTSPFDAGAPGRPAGDLITIISNNYDASYDSSNLLDIETHPGGTPVTGIQPAGSYRVTGTAAFDTTAGTEVLVLVFHGTPNKTVQGDESTWREELIGGGGPTFVTSEVPIDGKGARPIFTVWARTGAGAPWTPLAYNGGAVATDGTDFGYTVGTKTIDTFVPAAYAEVRVLYQCERVI